MPHFTSVNSDNQKIKVVIQNSVNQQYYYDWNDLKTEYSDILGSVIPMLIIFSMEKTKKALVKAH